mmetsp:Transcript_48001/g.89026  ORF Transcript_48001/g.89026 Transcript_48001/m.89026 type:complete len:255 (-) Transcript_48001:470-1234(-)
MRHPGARLRVGVRHANERKEKEGRRRGELGVHGEEGGGAARGIGSGALPRGTPDRLLRLPDRHGRILRPDPRPRRGIRPRVQGPGGRPGGRRGRPDPSPVGRTEEGRRGEESGGVSDGDVRRGGADGQCCRVCEVVERQGGGEIAQRCSVHGGGLRGGEEGRGRRGRRTRIGRSGPSLLGGTGLRRLRIGQPPVRALQRHGQLHRRRVGQGRREARRRAGRGRRRQRPGGGLRELEGQRPVAGAGEGVRRGQGR